MTTDFENKLLRGIPLDDAADYYVRLRSFGKTASPTLEGLKAEWEKLSAEEKTEVLKESGVDEKTANALMGGGQTMLPPTAKGMNMQPTPQAPLPPTAMGNQKMAGVSQSVGEHLGKHETTYRATGGAVLGGLTGAALGGMHGKNPLVGAAIGAGVGGLGGAAEAAYNKQKAKFHQGYRTQKEASDKEKKDDIEVGRHRAHASIAADHEKHEHSHGEHAFKNIGTAVGAIAGGRAAHHLGKASPVITATGAGIGAMIGRSAGRDAGKELDVRSFKQKHGAAPPPDMSVYAQQELAGQDAQEQNAAAYYQQRFQEAMQQLQMTQQQAQQAQQMADQLQVEVAQSQAQVQAAMEHAQLSSQGALTNVQNAHAMAMEATQNAMQSQEEILRQKQLAAAMRMGVLQVKDQVMNALSNDPTEQLAGALQSPPPGSAGPMGPQTPGGQDAGMATASQQAGTEAPTATQEGPAGAAPNPDSQPNSAPSGEPKSSGKSKSSDSSSDKSDAKGTTEVSVKHGSFSLPHAAAGAVVGAGIGAGYSAMSNDKLRGQVSDLEGAQNGSFTKALALAQARVRLAMGELAEGHPLATAATGALAGAVEGGNYGPDMVSKVREMGGRMKQIAGNLRGGA